MRKTLNQLALASASIALLAGVATSAQAQSVVSFGDSLSDVGNLFLVSGQPPSPPYFNGRFSNGPVFTEILAGPMQPAGAATVGGRPINPNANQNYAFGGARTDRLTSPDPADPLPPGIPQQIDFFQAQDGRFAAGDVVTLYGGANNIFQAIQAPGATPTSIGGASVAAAADIGASTARLAGLGAPTIVVLNLPDIGATPSFNTTITGSLAASAATAAFNTALSHQVFAAAGANPGANVFLVDVAGVASEIAADPARFGFTNTTQACLSVPACAGADVAAQNQFQYFDGVHPTTAVHELFAGLVADYLGAGESAADAGSMSEVAFFDRLDSYSALLDRARQAATGIVAPPAGSDAMRAVSFGSAYLTLEGSAYDRNATERMSGYDYRSGSLRLGTDARLSDRFLLGGAVSAMQGEVDESFLTYDVQSFGADLYATAQFGAAYLTVSGGVAHYDFEDFSRQTAIAGLFNRGGNTDGFAANAGAEAGYALTLGALTVIPTLGLTYAHFDADGFDESGGGARIVYGDVDRDLLYGAANLHLAYSTLLAGRQTLLTGRIGYEDVISGDDHEIASTIAGSPSRPSLAALDDVPGRGLILGAGLDADLTERFGLGAKYSVGFSDEIDVSHVGSLSVKLRF